MRKIDIKQNFKDLNDIFFLLVNDSSIGLIIFDSNLNIVYNNLAYLSKIISKDLKSEEIILLIRKIQRIVNDDYKNNNLEYFSDELNLKLINKEDLWLKYTIKKFYNQFSKNVQYIIFNFIDITECKLNERKYKEKSQIDFLTNVFNRTYFEERFEVEVQRCTRSEKPLSIIMIDIDDFKKINDLYGHNIGDIVLKDVANIIKNSFHRKSDFVARYGGDEFICLLPYTNYEGSKRIVARILFNMNNYNNCLINNKKVTVSIGIYTQVSQKNLDKELIFEKVDQALYFSKNKGKNTYTHYEDIKNLQSN